MVSKIEDTSVTVEAFTEVAAAHPEKLLELWNGEIHEKVTSEEHGKIAAIIVSELRLYLKDHSDIKGHFAVEASYRPPNTERYEVRPDVSFRLTEESVSRAAAIEALPDFVVEVKSPTNGYAELREKAAFYLAHGTRLVWLVYPAKQIVEVYDAEGSELYLSDETLDGGAVLPDFSLTVSEIFDL